MSVARTSECVLCLFRRSTRTPALRSRRSLHWTPVRRADDTNGTKSEKADTIDIVRKGREAQTTPAEKWKEQYDDRQVEAIEAAKKLIGERFDEGRHVGRTDPWSVDYYDNFEKIDPVVDEPVRAPWENLDDEQRMKTSKEADEEFQEFIDSVPTKESSKDDSVPMKYIKFFDNQRVTVGKEEAEFNARSAMAPTIPSPPKAPATKAPLGKEAAEKKERETTPEFIRLMQMTGFSARELDALRVKSIVAHNVSNQTRLGKVRKMYFLSIAGNQNGLLGIGEAKSEDIGNAKMQSQARAIRNMQPIKRYENRTIFGTINGKVAATELELYARPPGFGLRCQELLWEMAVCAGIHDLAARVTRARNPMNTVKAAYQALLGQKDPEDIARARGKKLVDVRKVYYAGQV